MKKKTICKLAIYSLVVVLLGGGYLYFKSGKQNKSGENRPLTTIIADSIYDSTRSTEDIEENNISETEIETNNMENGEDLITNEKVIKFWMQYEKQSREYADNYNLKKSQEGLKKIWDTVRSFWLRGEELKGAYYNKLSIETQEKLLVIFNNICLMRFVHVTPEKYDLIVIGEYTDIMMEDFVHANKKD